ncbi:MAG: hypothetical protein A3H42_06805 [Deltaproteobacteria bacterium RIFCSPLOWO2_02_FULL_46_8]|nr:MAG: hypothetical protein A3H42_06805 [Deltaproteobacteria bacterium RIFCSPLOWO2_02_FULL_46_8]
MKRITSFILFGFVAFCLTACGGTTTNGGEDYGDILSTSQGLTLTQSEHTIGWSKSECTMCHNLENIHLVDRTGVTDIVAVHNQAIRDGITGCAACHGTNGMP